MPPEQFGSRSGPTARLRIIHTTDLHGAVRSFDYCTDRVTQAGALSRLASLIEAARAECDASLLCDNGDFLFGTALTDQWAESGDNGPHPMITAMNMLGYDAAALGNHELNYGIARLSDALGAARFPVLCANLYRGEATLLPPTQIVTRKITDSAGNRLELKLGLIAVVPPQVMQWDAAHLAEEYSAKGMAQSVRHHVAALRAQGADLIVVLNHSGIVDGPDTPAQENAALSIAAIDGVDAVLCGHQHRLFPGKEFAGIAGVDAQRGLLLGKPAVMSGFGGSHLGVIDFDLMRDGAGRWQIAHANVSLRAAINRDGPNETAPEAPSILQSGQKAHDAIRAHMARVVGQADTPLTSYFAHIAPSPTARLVAAAQSWHARRLLADRPEGSLPLLAASSVFRCGGTGGPENYIDISAGPVRLRDIYALYDFPNTLALVEMTGADVADWLEQASGLFHTIAPGVSGQPLTSRNFPSYDFDILWGLSYRINLSRTATITDMGTRTSGAPRVEDIQWNGQPLNTDQRFIVATNSFRADGGGEFLALRHARRIEADTPRVRDLLAEFFAAGAPVPDWPMPWEFASLPGTTVRITSGPGSLPYADQIAALGLTPRGLDADGFALFDLPL